MAVIWEYPTKVRVFVPTPLQPAIVTVTGVLQVLNTVSHASIWYVPIGRPLISLVAVVVPEASDLEGLHENPGQ
jgi:hypothetical protein